MNWWLVGLGGFFLLVVLIRLDHYIEWRRSTHGRHSVTDHQPSRDEEEPITEILPIIRDYEPYLSFYDPSFYRLSKAVKRWHDSQ